MRSLRIALTRGCGTCWQEYGFEDRKIVVLFPPEADHSPPSRTEAMNDWSYVPIPPIYLHMGYTGTTSLYLYTKYTPYILVICTRSAVGDKTDRNGQINDIFTCFKFSLRFSLEAL